jgi:hypothetical protein
VAAAAVVVGVGVDAADCARRLTFGKAKMKGFVPILFELPTQDYPNGH